MSLTGIEIEIGARSGARRLLVEHGGILSRGCWDTET
jgi:hypothetical protein